VRVLAGTARGLAAFAPDGTTLGHELAGRQVRALAPAGWSSLWALVDGIELWRRRLTGPDLAWSRVAALPGVEGRCLADTRANHEAGILVGTAGARLARVDEQGRVAFVASFDAAPGRDAWFTPWGGPPDTRSLSENGDSVFANVHVGGVLRSRDEGATWQPTLDIGEDVHRVVTAGSMVFAAGAHGISISTDGGDSWRRSADGLQATYCRAVAVCGDTLLVSASDGPRGGRAAVYRAELDGRSFERCRTGLPEWFEGNVDSLALDALPEGELAAFGTEEGDLYASGDQGRSWNRIATGMEGIAAVLTLP
jgi:hypothetical protein